MNKVATSYELRELKEAMKKVATCYELRELLDACPSKDCVRQQESAVPQSCLLHVSSIVAAVGRRMPDGDPLSLDAVLRKS